MSSTSKNPVSTPMPAGVPAGALVADVGERALVDYIVSACASPSADVLLGPGDDAAVVAAPDGRVVITTDMAVEGVHFRTDWSTAGDVGHRIAAANLADIAAMGARPTGLVVALALSPTTPVAWVSELLAGLLDETGDAGACVVGGDVTQGDRITVSVTALGDLEGRAPVSRSGARIGDTVAVCGRLGWAAAGLAVLSRGFRSPRALVDAHRRPQPEYRSGVAAALAGAHAMMDVSDGLLLDADRMGRASGVIVNVEAREVPVADPIASTAAAYNIDPLQWVLGGGDDHALLASFDPRASLPPGFVCVGKVTADDGGGPGVRLDGRVPATPTGFEHFRGR